MRAHCAQYETYMQIAGKGRCLAADRLREAIARSSALHQVLLRYVQVFLRQTTETALANGRGNIAHRRFRVTVLDRKGLEEGSNGAYSRPTVDVPMPRYVLHVQDGSHILENYVGQDFDLLAAAERGAAAAACELMAEALRWGKPLGRQKKMLINNEAGRTVSTVKPTPLGRRRQR